VRRGPRRHKAAPFARPRQKRGATAAEERDDFDLVAVAQRRRRVLRAPHELLVAFDGHVLRLQR